MHPFQSSHVLAIAVFAVSMLFAPGAHAGALDQLRDFVSTTKSARGEFSQRQIRAGAGPQAGATGGAQTSGSFAFSRPGRFRWEVSRPFAQTVVADGERLWLHDPDLNQVTVRRLSDSLGSSPAAILFGTSDIERDFAMREAGTRDGLEWLDAQPRQPDSGFERISIGFRRGLPEAMEVRDAFGQTTILAFKGIERNPKLAPDAFRFTPPKGADVVEQ